MFAIVCRRRLPLYISQMTRRGKGKPTIAIIGYGSQGRALALNLRDSGFAIVLGLRPNSKSARLARKERFGPSQICDISTAVRIGDVVTFAFPDWLHQRVYEKSIRPSLKSDATLLFLHGTSIHFKLITPPKNSDIIMLAPHAPGVAVRERFMKERDISAFYAIHRNASGHALQTILSIADGCGFAKKRLVKTTFKDEAIGDLFGEQAVLCGGLSALIKSGFETLVTHGIKPEHAWLEVAYQLDLIIALIKKHGISGMLDRISVAARYGAIETGPKLIDTDVAQSMERVFGDIESGRFVRKLNGLQESDIKKLRGKYSRLTSGVIEKAAKKAGGK